MKKTHVQLIYDDLQGLADMINHGTAALAMQGMVHEEMIQGLAWAFQIQAGRVYRDILQHEEQDEEEQAHLQHQVMTDDNPDQDSQHMGFEGGSPYESDNHESTVDDGAFIQDLSRYNFDREVVTISPLYVVAPAHASARNPMLFGMPFVLAPLEGMDGDERHGDNDSSRFTPRDVFMFVSAVATFNLGLAKHMQALALVQPKDEQNRKRLLQQALACYEKAYHLIDAHVLLSPDGTVVVLHLALCNNLAEVYADLGMPTRSNHWQESLRECLHTIPPAMESSIYRHFEQASVVYGMNLKTATSSNNNNSVESFAQAQELYPCKQIPTVGSSAIGSTSPVVPVSSAMSNPV